jgi:predicted short-subunit dehydrogenase-like oxidoreductase (DUF2520 family)
LCGTRSATLATSSNARVARMADLLLLAVPDEQISVVAQKLATARRVDWPEKIVLHHAGALGPDPLAALAARGASVGVFHPLQCLGSTPQAARLLAGSSVRIEGSAAAVKVAQAIAAKLGMVPLRLPGSDLTRRRAAYHAAAALVSNDLLALLSLGLTLMGRAGLTDTQAISALLPLIDGTLAQVRGGTLQGALSGPALRGDLATVREHLGALAAVSSDAPEIHRLLSLRLLELDPAAEQRSPGLRTKLRVLTPRS